MKKEEEDSERKIVGELGKKEIRNVSGGGQRTIFQKVRLSLFAPETILNR